MNEPQTQHAQTTHTHTHTKLQVTPSMASPDLFPAPYSNLPILMFPYPKKVEPASVIICNHSGERYWYAWDDATEKAWENGIVFVCAVHNLRTQTHT